MRGAVKKQIIELIDKNKGLSPNELMLKIGVSTQVLHRHLKKLVETGVLKKIGKSPRVVYQLKKVQVFSSLNSIDILKKKFLEERYLYISPTGELLYGEKGFFHWAQNTKQEKNIDFLISEFIKTRKELDQFIGANELIKATEKFSKTFLDKTIEDVFYSDFYSLPKYGKTILGTLVLHAKQAQDKNLIKKVADLCIQPILKFIQKNKIEAIAWTPHSIPRKYPFLKLLKENWNLKLPEITFYKAYEGEIPVAQKSLSKLEERIQNATSTIFLKNPEILYQKILIIDDAVGSGSTLHAIAQKIKEKNKKTKVYGYALVGSFKGFEVIKEV